MFVCGLGEWVTGTGFRVAAVLDSAICESSEGEQCPILEIIMSLPVQMLWIGSLSPVVAETGSVSKVSVVLVSRMKVGFCELKSHIYFDSKYSWLQRFFEIFPVEPPNVTCPAQ